MGSIRQRLMIVGEQAAPRGRVRWLQLRTSADMLMTLAIGVGALALSLGYQLLLHLRAGGSASRR